ncbi:hypothetical protein [Spongiactinospora sp. TRM90649]|uniref:hypothetical protein n=1 Tax=Spongiactinospora sp. TRM90649 TaxID=3031114 RepID=UPI0023F95104|nr:hypothetical protein [Spongiactinospora sp. TRM90649]
MVAWPVRPSTGPKWSVAAGDANLNASARNVLGVFYCTSFGESSVRQVAIRMIGAVIDRSDDQVGYCLFPALARKNSLRTGRVASKSSRKEAS